MAIAVKIKGGITSNFIGATAVTDGVSGLVPAPLAGQETYVLSGNGTWVPGPSSWVIVTGNTTMVPNTNYIVNAVSTVTFTLPATFIVGSEIKIVGYAGGWQIAQNALQSIHWGNMSTTQGVAGSLVSSLETDCIDMVAINANTDFVISDSNGQITVN